MPDPPDGFVLDNQPAALPPGFTLDTPPPKKKIDLAALNRQHAAELGLALVPTGNKKFGQPTQTAEPVSSQESSQPGTWQEQFYNPGVRHFFKTPMAAGKPIGQPQPYSAATTSVRDLLSGTELGKGFEALSGDEQQPAYMRAVGRVYQVLSGMASPTNVASLPPIMATGAFGTVGKAAQLGLGAYFGGPSILSGIKEFPSNPGGASVDIATGGAMMAAPLIHGYIRSKIEASRNAALADMIARTQPTVNKIMGSAANEAINITPQARAGMQSIFDFMPRQDLTGDQLPYSSPVNPNIGQGSYLPQQRPSPISGVWNPGELGIATKPIFGGNSQQVTRDVRSIMPWMTPGQEPPQVPYGVPGTVPPTGTDLTTPPPYRGPRPIDYGPTGLTDVGEGRGANVGPVGATYEKPQATPEAFHAKSIDARTPQEISDNMNAARRDLQSQLAEADAAYNRSVSTSEKEMPRYPNETLGDYRNRVRATYASRVLEGTTPEDMAAKYNLTVAEARDVISGREPYVKSTGTIAPGPEGKPVVTRTPKLFWEQRGVTGEGMTPEQEQLKAGGEAVQETKPVVPKPPKVTQTPKVRQTAERAMGNPFDLPSEPIDENAVAEGSDLGPATKADIDSEMQGINDLHSSLKVGDRLKRSGSSIPIRVTSVTSKGIRYQNEGLTGSGNPFSEVFMSKREMAEFSAEGHGFSKIEPAKATIPVEAPNLPVQPIQPPEVGKPTPAPKATQGEPLGAIPGTTWTTSNGVNNYRIQSVDAKTGDVTLRDSRARVADKPFVISKEDFQGMKPASLKSRMGRKTGALDVDMPTVQAMVDAMIKAGSSIKGAIAAVIKARSDNPKVDRPLLEQWLRLKGYNVPSVILPVTQPKKESNFPELLQAIKEARSKTAEQQAGYEKERGIRIGQYSERASKTGGWADLKASRGAMGGELPQPEFEPIGSKLKEGTRDGLAQTIRDYQTTSKRSYTGLTAFTGLEKVLDKGVVPAPSEIDAIEAIFGKGLADAIRQPSFAQKAGDLILRLQRFSLLSGPASMGKIGVSGATTDVLSTIETAIGKLLQHLPVVGEVAKKASIEGNASTANVGKGFKSEFSANTLSEIAKSLTKGENSLDEEYGHYEGPNDPILEFFQRSHNALKTPTQIRTFEWAKAQQIDWYKKNGLGDLTPTQAAQQILERAYDRSLQAKLMNPNAASEGLSTVRGALQDPRKMGKFVGAGRAASFISKFEMPITRVPTNFASIWANMFAGGPIGVGKIVASNVRSKGFGRGMIESFTKDAASEMTADEADSVMRAFKRQGVGVGAFALGWYLKNQIQEDPKTHEVKMFGHAMPSWAQHTPAFGVMLAGAGVAHARDEGRPITEELVKRAQRELKNLPLLEQPAQTYEALQDPQSLGNFLGRQIKTFIPQAEQQGARYFDDNQRRKAKGFTQQLQEGTPLRNRLPAQ